jgi:hypothetical protein
MEYLARICILTTVFCFYFGSNQAFAGDYWAVSHHTHDHEFEETLYKYFDTYISAGRIHVVTTKKGVAFSSIPSVIRANLRSIDPQSVFKSQREINRYYSNLRDDKADPKIADAVAKLRADDLDKMIRSIVQLGPRPSKKSTAEIMKTFREIGYTPRNNYNIEVLKKGKKFPNEYVLVVAHMDTVAGVVGADDNASGTAALIEIARQANQFDFERSVLFLLTDGEELGLVGSRRFVQEWKKNKQLDKIKFVVNMDMISYNKNGIVDLETEPEFKSLASWMALQTRRYTNLKPNIMLHAWASDHVPFIKAGVPCLLTIEYWKTHTPCWHKKCDKMDMVNVKYATEIARLNFAAILQKGRAVFP